MTYSFCLSIPFGMIITFGGLCGYFTKGSLVSLQFSSIFGGLILFFGYIVCYNL